MIDRYTGGAFQTNGYVLSLPDGFRVLVDAPEDVTGWLVSREYGIDLLLLTHLHHDHVIDAAAVKREFGCPIWSHSQPDPDLTLESVLAGAMPWVDSIEPFESDRLLAGETEIRIGPEDEPLGVLHVPGHSPDSLCFGPFAHEDLEGPPVLFGGDVLFRGGIGRTDFPHGDHDLLTSGIREKIFALSDDTEVLPGHGPATTVGIEKRTNPFLAEM